MISFRNELGIRKWSNKKLDLVEMESHGLARRGKQGGRSAGLVFAMQGLLESPCQLNLFFSVLIPSHVFLDSAFILISFSFQWHLVVSTSVYVARGNFVFPRPTPVFSFFTFLLPKW